MKKLNVILTRPARSKGGDRYECPIAGEAKPFVIYVPQFISREGGEVKKSMTVTFE